MSSVTAIVDGHVHMHACYQLDVLMDSAHHNLSRSATAAAAYFLLLTETAQDDYFGALRTIALGGVAPRGLDLRRWSIRATSEPISVVAENGRRRLYMIAGSQIACREGLEVLLIGTTDRFEDGLPIRDVLAATATLGVPRVIPWGPGKWLFRRGRLLQQLLEEFHRTHLFLGDEGGRPGFWGYPAHFERGLRLGVRDLPGTDPLPFAHDVHKVGRMGFRVSLDLDSQRPAHSLLQALACTHTPLDRFATLEPPLRFVRNQIGMQLRKRRAN